MPRSLRGFLLGCIAVAFAYLVIHAREPLRLNIGDPAEILHGAIGTYLGVGISRLLALAISALALWLLFQYARRIWSDTVALVAAVLVATSLLWMLDADSLHQVPVMQASGFLALWGLVRAIETRQRRYDAAAFVGSWVCCLTSYDYWLVLPAAVLFTVHSKLGPPFARGNRHLVMIGAAGCIAGIVAHGLIVAGAAGEPARLASVLPDLPRRYTFVLAPMFWITLGHTTWRALRAPSPSALIADGVTWLLVVAASSLVAFSPLAASPLLGARSVLLFYAIGSAVLIGRLLDGGRLRRGLAIAWIAAAPVWSFSFLLTHRRAVLDRDDVAQANAYLAANDRNDFVLSNLIPEGPIEAAFGRHHWAALDGDTAQVALKMLDVLEGTGTDYVHAVIFTTPDPRFLTGSLGHLAVPRRSWAVPGRTSRRWSAVKPVVGEYDKDVLASLAAVDAKQILHLSNFDVYRIDRAAVLAAAGRSIPVVRAIDFGGIGSNKHKLLGWSEPKFTKDEKIAVSSIIGYSPCPNPVIEHPAGEPGRNACETVLTGAGLEMMDEGWVDRAQLMIRVERACDLRLTLELASPALLGMSIDDFAVSPCAAAKHVSFLIPRRSVRAGINIITFDKRLGPADLKADISSLAIEPVCEPD